MTATSATPETGPIRAALAAWYADNGRHTLPWRHTRNPYAVLVSEVMLQQTQVERVLPYYTAWLERWPDFAALAAASPAAVITAWSGLGYNRRARALQAAACIVVERHGGQLPADPAQLRTIPGIGPYTAAALCSFAFDQPVPVVDTNIARVLARACLGAPAAASVRPRAIHDAAAALLPPCGARDHNLALMDLGATVCAARNPGCSACPLAEHCAWRRLGCPPPTAAPRRPAPRFETTARYARGRIIERLRGGPATKPELAAMLPPAHRTRLGEYLAALERDGLVEPLPGDGWALPGTPA
ncbi:A/G-specific adenine glycosylase [Tepidiforma sp.]|uniref:A/G-specific adenine glycosylase n=1 Tax=Tepidiforma sp. TaxID=2682230 RepID=UPI002ADE6046|nr:A/G-specific adenine glycosylase [Tepidiforma sp.]